MADRRSVSLRQRLQLRLWGLAILFALALATSLWFARQGAEEERQFLLNLQADKACSNVLRRIDFYHRAVARLADDPLTLGQLRHGRPESRHEWAQTRLDLFPGTYGLALVDPAGKILGDAGKQRIASRITEFDIDQAKTGNWPNDTGSEQAESKLNLSDPGLHVRLGDRVAHFAMARSVKDANGTMLGGVLLSFGLDQMQRVLDDSVYPGHSLVLIAGDGRIFMRAGRPDVPPTDIRRPLEDTGWILAVGAEKPELSRANVALIVTTGLTLIAVIVVMIEGIARLRRGIEVELQEIHNSLKAVAMDAPITELTPHYEEFAPPMREINHIARLIQSQRAELARLSQTDALTGLPNRRALEERFGQLRGLAQRDFSIALVLLDLDSFKAVNDSLGHEAGDRVLQIFATALTAVSRGSDLVVRQAGDEFVALLAGLDEAGVRAWYLRLSDRLQAELRALGMDGVVSISAGMSWLNREDGLDAVMARADRALYQAKARGRAQLVIIEEAQL
jgi:diguanylate cyclase (GGDEF)-like protein